MTHLDFPLRVDGRGRTAVTDNNDHLRDLIEQVVFTAPGERVNRPTFGSGLLALVFAPNSVELLATTQFLVQGALEQWLGNLIQVDDIDIESDDARLRVVIRYTVRRTQEQRTAELFRQGP
jgi:phage baseplate assembly protein W